MSLTAIPMARTQLTNAAAIYYTCPANSSVIVRHVNFCNTTAGAITVTAYIVPNGGAVGDSTTVIHAQSIAGNAAYVSPELSGVVLNAGDTFQALASAATSISVNASGILQQ